MPFLTDEHDEHCYFLRPIFGCQDDDSSSGDVCGISDCDFEARPIFGCKDNESLSDDSNERSDCDSEAIHSESDGTESCSRIASSTGTVLVGDNGNNARFSGSDDDKSSIENSTQLNTMSDQCINCQQHQVAVGFDDTMPCVLSLSTYSRANMRTRVGWSCIHSDDLQGLDQIILCSECASF
jgi:hypothetical protein